ncbi:HTH_48 domain-containing protein [Trichonephila clavipes]|nr:HTH_48 domain-containing protein [Trichonephila clavipes]
MFCGTMGCVVTEFRARSPNTYLASLQLWTHRNAGVYIMPLTMGPFATRGEETRAGPFLTSSRQKHGTGGKGNILQSPAPGVFAATDHKTFGPTTLASTYSEGGIVRAGARLYHERNTQETCTGCQVITNLHHILCEYEVVGNEVVGNEVVYEVGHYAYYLNTSLLSLRFLCLSLYFPTMFLTTGCYANLNPCDVPLPPLKVCPNNPGTKCDLSLLRPMGTEALLASGRPPCELQAVKNGSQQRETRYILQFFFDKGENASHMTGIVNGVHGAYTVTANYVQFWFRRFRSGIFDARDAPRTDKPVVANVNKITEIIKVDQHKQPELAKRQRRKRSYRRGVVLHQDNAKPYMSIATRQKLWELGWEVLMHPPYSPESGPGTKRLPPFSRTAKLPE